MNITEFSTRKNGAFVGCKYIRFIVFFVFLLHRDNAVFAQSLPPFDIGIPISIDAKDANANGYFNTYTSNIIIEQQNKGIITRLLYDTLFNLQKKYTAKADSITFADNSRLPSFIKSYCTASGNFEVYATNKLIQIWRIDFEKEADVKVAEFVLKSQYADERLVSVICYNEKVSFLTMSAKKDKLVLNEYALDNNNFVTKEFNLPEKSLTKDEINERGKFLSVNYNEILNGLYASNLQTPKKFEITTANQLFYDENKIYIVLNTPYKTGVHLLELNPQNGTSSFTNFLINKTAPDDRSTYRENFVSATAFDSLFIIQNSTTTSLEYYFYNIKSKQLLQHYKATTDDSFYTIVNSSLKQSGTYGSKNEDKEINNERLFMRRKNKGTLFLKAFKTDNDSLLISFGSYNPTEGVGGTLLSFATMGLSSMLLYNPANFFQFTPYLTTSRNKFLFAYSKFCLSSLQPSTATNIETVLNKLVTDKKIEGLKKESSFIIDKKNQLFIGIFDKEKNKYLINRY